ncbi:MAG: indole-3-glycerol phosphate synthase TrpC, partial [Chloroflexi bacterium]|nr:indole-3-glycerol phosphate synthase TrpC [Chloroflexota bacterium]
MRPGITSTGTILDRIVQQKIVEITAAESRMPLGALKEAIMQAPTVQDFAGALRRDHIALIAEVKKASPSKGIFLEDFDPVGIASEYEQHGAAAISVLTDERFFQGHLDYLRHVRTQVSIPVLRKDFLIDPYQVYEARAAGADAVLLIVACLEDPVLHDLHALVLELGMAALVEVHNEAEMQRALAVPGIGVIGINNRDLHDFSVDLQTA